MVENWNNKGGFMADKEWLFSEYNFSPRSLLGTCLVHEINKIDGLTISDEEKRIISLENLGRTIGCEIKPNDFLALGPVQYLELRKDVNMAVVRRVNQLNKKRK